jgi:RNA recognition motif-containing protein
MNIYVGNLPLQASDQELEDLFKEFGHLSSAKIIRDMFSGESRGFGFVEINDKAAALKAIEAINLKEFKGKKLVVNEARPKNDNRRGGGGRDNRGGGGGQRRRY